jgi:hypothetical protein
MIDGVLSWESGARGVPVSLSTSQGNFSVRTEKWNRHCPF